MKRLILILSLLVFLAGCIGKGPEPVEPPQEPVEPLVPVAWDEVAGWQLDRPAEGLRAFVASCKAIGRRDQWAQVCQDARDLAPASDADARAFFEKNFQPYQVVNDDGSSGGLITGYYGPELEGSRVPSEEYRYPLYRQPDDLLIIDLAGVYPELGNYRLRGRVEGSRVVPYFDRSEIDGKNSPLFGQELFWVKDPVELFFLHIQGSGRIKLPDGERVMINYANQNGYPYRSIGKLLLERKAMTRDQMSMQNIRRWVQEHPQAGQQLLAENPSYVFFRELSSDYLFPPGALGIPLTPLRSLAVDPRTIPLGAPVFIATTYPGTDFPLEQLMVAQDTGGAIKGQVRADFFWGMGHEAGEIAGKMKQEGRLWVFLPKVQDTASLQGSISAMDKKQGGVN